VTTIATSAIVSIAGALLVAWHVGAAAQERSSPSPPTNLYRDAEPFGVLPAGRTIGQTSAIDIDSKGHVWVAGRCGANTCAGKPDAPILEFDDTGKLIRSFGAGMLVYPHGIAVDRDDNVWVTDGQGAGGMGHQVFKFSPEGKLLLTLGKAGVAGGGNDEFNQPADVLVASSGDIFVADGHAPGYFNARIVKFSKDGKFIKSWGRRGSGRGEFEGAHCLAMDSLGRLFVGDRTNNRIEIFDQDGNFIAEWKQFGRPSGLYIDKNDVLYVADSESTESVVTWTGAYDFLPKGYGYNPGVKRGIRIGSAVDGKVTAFIPDPTHLEPPVPTSAAEGVVADSHGVVYGAEVGAARIVRYLKK
jgi:sugar lactone lactonase YvrE